MSILSIDKNTIPIINGVNSSGFGDLLDLQEVTVFGSGISMSSGTHVTYGDYLNITFSGSGYIEKALTDATTSLTVDCRAHSSSSIVTATVYDPTQTTVISKRKIGHTAFPQKIAMEFSSGIGQTLRLEGSNAGIHLYNVYADTGLRVNYGYKYLGFYSTSITGSTQHPIITELWLNTTDGTSIKYNETSDFNDDYTNFHEIIDFHSTYTQFEALFNGDVSWSEPYLSFVAGRTGMFFWLELSTSRDITSGKYWTYGLGNHSFDNLFVYGTNIDPATMTEAEQNDISSSSKWTLLTELSKAYVNETYTYP